MNTLPKDKNESEVKFVRYIIPGDPVSSTRPANGFYSVDTNKRFYFKNYISNQHDEKPFLQGPLKLDIIFYFKIALRKQGKSYGLKPDSFMVYKPNFSYLIRFIEEVSTGILFEDDCIIASISAQKRYDTTPRTEFTLMEMYSENTERKVFEKK